LRHSVHAIHVITAVFVQKARRHFAVTKRPAIGKTQQHPAKMATTGKTGQRSAKPAAIGKTQQRPAKLLPSHAAKKTKKNFNPPAARSESVDADVMMKGSSLVSVGEGSSLAVGPVDADEMKHLMTASVAESDSKLFHTAQTIAHQVISHNIYCILVLPAEVTAVSFSASLLIFYAPQLYRQVLLRARTSYGNSVCLSVCHDPVVYQAQVR